MIEFKLRKGTGDDLKISYEIMKNALGEYVKQTWGWDEAWQLEHHRNDFDPNILSIIEVNGEAAAMLEEEIETNVIRVSGIYIIDRFQSKGIGKALMESVISRAKETNKNVILQVLKVNVRAMKFYKSLGFVAYGENRHHHQMLLRIRDN